MFEIPIFRPSLLQSKGMRVNGYCSTVVYKYRNWMNYHVHFSSESKSWLDAWLKTQLHLAYKTHGSPTTGLCALILPETLALYKSFTYLLTYSDFHRKDDINNKELLHLRTIDNWFSSKIVQGADSMFISSQKEMCILNWLVDYGRLSVWCS